MKRPTPWRLLSLSLPVSALIACGGSGTTTGHGDVAEEPTMSQAGGYLYPDAHSFARPDQVTVEHLSLDLDVDFDAKRLSGTASLRIVNKTRADALYLDTRDLDIEQVTLDEADTPVAFVLGEVDDHLGQELRIPIEAGTQIVHVRYASRPEAAAVQWLSPEQTTDGNHPFLFTQSQAILARTWVPCQDTPSVRMTYDATIRVPPALLAVMSAENPTAKRPDGVYSFTMPQAIPSYLLALAVGDLAFAEMGPRTGVYAEPSVVEKAAWEFAETEAMIDAAEALYGPYRWGRYDLLVLPASFPFGGMENPRLTFATPTIIAGDRSLMALVAHELAHSWSGNLVTNATWNDFWLNEGFTVYFEKRIMESVYGADYAEMLSVLDMQGLVEEIADISAETPADTHLFLDLAGRDPDDGMTAIAYDKGHFFLRTIEKAVGRERFDTFLRTWFDGNAFHSRTTTDFETYLKSELLAGDHADAVDVAGWIYGPGLPAGVAMPSSDALTAVDAQIEMWNEGAKATGLDTEGWSTHQWLRFLRGLPEAIPADRLADLDAAFGFNTSGNSEITHDWLHHVIRNQYEPGYDRLRGFLTNVGRRKFLKPLYERLAETESGLAMARAIYVDARPGYHSVSSNTIDEILATDPAS